MNKNRFRIIFNQLRSLMMVVAENVKSHTATAESAKTSSSTSLSPSFTKDTFVNIRPLAFSLMCALGLVAIVPNSLNISLAQADIIADKTAAKNQQPIIFNAPNGVPYVNIQTPSAAGVSRNAYSRFDVDLQGVILNNSHSNVQTQLGGWIPNNPFLAAAEARIILNEINSSNPSYLNGYIEIAGSRAELIIANPNGISCNGCGFINASRGILTTGTPILSGGALTGYRVTGGTVNIWGNGLDASRSNYTDIIARAVEVNAGIWANDLKITTGANTVNAANTQTSTIAASGASPASGIALDVAALGGMYAGKITLIGTEAGLGVRNAGVIGASSGNLTLTADGRLENTNTIIGSGNITISTTDSIGNTGTVYAQGNTSLTTQADINNSGLIAAQGNTDLVANGANSHISSTANAVLAAGLQADGTLTTSGNLNISATQSITALGQNLSAGDQILSAKQLDISGSNTFASNLTLIATNGDIQAHNATIGANQTLTASTTRTLTTDAAKLSASQLNLVAHDLSNVGGELVQTGVGDTSINLVGDLNNSQGRIATNSNNLTLIAQSISNTNASIEHAGAGTLAITTTNLNGTAGQIISNGALDLTATTATLDNGSTNAKQINVDTATLSNRSGEFIQTGSDATSIHASTSLDNTDGIVASNGTTTLTVGDLINQGGTIQVSGQAAGTSNLTVNATGAINNTSLNSVAGNINAGGTAIITADSLNNTQGQITAGDTLTISTISNSSALQNTQGLIASNQTLTLNTASLNNIDGTIASVHDGVAITARTGSINNSEGQISASQNLSTSSYGLNNTAGSVSANSASINSQSQTLDNSNGSIITNVDLDLQTGALINDNGLIQSGANLVVNTHNQTLTNINSGASKGILALGSSTFTSGNLNNQTGYIAARGAITANSTNINNNTGAITGEATISLTGSSLDNHAGRVEALGNVDINATSNIDNRTGLLRSGQTLNLTTTTLDNRNTQNTNNGIEGSSVLINADQTDNAVGAMRADNALAITGSGSLNNSQGNLSSAGSLNITDRLANTNSNVNTKTLAVTNTGGTIIAGAGIAGTGLNIDTQSLSGDGKVLSQGDLSTKLTSNYTHSGEWQADGNATFTTSGNISNHAKLLAGGDLDITAANLDNKATGEIAGANLNLAIADTLTNRGLLDGSDTFIKAATLNNIGTGRIYGDHVAIATTTLNNREETINGSTKAAVIAARDQLDIGAHTITNRNDALIFSAGDMAIGGSLDANHQATVAAGEPQVTSLINSGATIEALGNLQLSVADLQNLNPALDTQQVQIATGSFHRFTPRGRSEVLNADDFPLWQIGNFNMSWRYGSTYNMPFNFREYYRYIGSTTTTETQVVASNPGQILSGGNLNISGNVTNSDSQIIAGGLLDVTAAAVQNLNSEGSTVKRYTGSAYYYDYDGNESCGDPGDGCYDISYLGAYNPANEEHPFSLNISKLAQLSSVPGTGTQVAALDIGSVTQTATGANNVNVAVVTGSNQGGNTQLAPVITNTQTGAGTIVSTVNPNTALPNNSLFHTNPNPTAGYYVETDPRFANYRTWLSSDYMLKALSYDPATVTKRLGDGFYEQRLIREQIAQLTGQRFLAGYSSDEEAYRALMTNGITFAQTYQLIPGVTLSQAQIAQLTSDIVWLVERTITLADGTTVQALLPQVYVRLQPGDINGQGTLLAGDSINLKLSGDLTNSGSIAGRTVVSITADNIHNLGGRISANNTQLNAHNDINNLGGSIQGNDLLSLQAGHDINIASTTQSSQNQTGLSSFSRTNFDRVAGLYVDNPNGILVASSGNNINLQGAVISNSGTNGITVLDAGNNLNLTTITTAEQNNTIKNSKNYIKHGNTQEIGAVIQTEGDLILNAGNNVSARAANVTSEQGNLTVNAANDINIEAGEATNNLAAARTTKKSGTFSSKKTTSRDSYNDTEVISSTFSGDSVDMNAGLPSPSGRGAGGEGGNSGERGNITITGSNVVGTNDVKLNAGNNITIESAQATHDETHYSKTKQSGFSASGTSIGYSKSTLTNTNDSQQVINVGSTVGSVEGNVNINAGKAYTQTASDVLTPQGDINITAQQVDINAATDTYANQQSMKYKQSGITVGVSSSALNLAQNVLGTTEAAVTSDSTRNKALNALQTYANGATLYEQGKGVVNAAKAGNVQDAAGAAGVRLSVSIGSTKAESSSTTNITAQQESLVKAGGNVNITATQDDLTIKGSQITADKNLTLDAAKNINLIASTDTESNQGKNKSSSTSIGVSVGVGAGGAGLSVDLAASRGKGSANSDSTTYNNTHVTAGETLTLKSGQDTNMIGANAAGKKVIANVGGDLNIQSLQDTATSKAKQSNTGISISVPIASPTLGNTFGAVSQSKQKSNSNYASVYEQSGIRSGDQGFNITTQGNTDLKGAVIESTATPNKNSLTTGTLTISNIQNHMEAEASSSGTTLNTKMLNSKYEATKAIFGNLQNHGEEDISDSSVTLSAISPGNITITDAAKQQQLTANTADETVAALNRDTTNTNRVLAKPDMQALQEKAQQEQADRMLAITAITAFTDEAYRSRLQATPKVFKVECPAGSNCQDNPKLLVRTEIDPKEIANVPAGSIVAVNGIMNDEKRGAELAYQNAELITDPVTGKKDKPTTVYLMHIAPATNAVSELLGVAYEKFTASSDYGLANFLGYTNGQELYADLLRSREQQATESLGHSRGTLAQEAAFTILANRQDEYGNTYTNPNLTVRGVGGAADAVAYTDKAIAIIGEKDKDNITYNYFSNDPVSTSIVTGGNIGIWTLKDLWQVYFTDNSMHSCYGTGAAGCTQVEIPVPGGPQGTPEGNAKLIQYQGGERIDNNPVGR